MLFRACYVILKHTAVLWCCDIVQVYAVSYGHVNSIQSVFVGDQFSSEDDQVRGAEGGEREQGRREGGEERGWREGREEDRKAVSATM